MIVDISMRIRLNVTINECNIAVVDNGKSTIERNVVLLDGFDFGALEDNPRFESFYDFIFVAGFAILANDFGGIHGAGFYHTMNIL